MQPYTPGQSASLFPPFGRAVFVPPFSLPSFFYFFRPAGFSCVPVPVLLSALYAAPAFFGRLALPGFRRFSLCFGFCSAVFLSEFCIVVEQLWFALQNAAKKGYTIDNQF
ncbi:MAG: hypothetical protein ACLUR9_07045 [Christensenellales bacterium]